MTWREWWKSALSKVDDISTTRICFLATCAFVFIMTVVLAVTGAFNLDWAWFLGSMFTTAWGGKDVAKYMEVKRDLGQNSHGGGGGTGTYRRNLMAKSGNQRPASSKYGVEPQ